jgi:hypothetical protein
MPATLIEEIAPIRAELPLMPGGAGRARVILVNIEFYKAHYRTV